MRSMLFVPGDSERKIAKSAEFSPDGLILDLEDSVAPARKDEARRLTREYLDNHPLAGRTKKILVRINPLDGGQVLDDLAAVVGGAPDTVLMPKFRKREDIIELDHYLSALEVREGIPAGHIRILVIATETGEGVLNMGSIKGSSDRISHVSWGEYDLGADVGAQTQFREDGSWDDLYRMARGMCLAAAAAAGVEPANTVYTDYRNPEGLRKAATEARRAGFTCMMAIHPSQVDVINEAFSVSEEELVWSQRVVEAFEANPDVGVAGLDGIMLDKPHYTQAKRTLARALAQGGL